MQTDEEEGGEAPHSGAPRSTPTRTSFTELLLGENIEVDAADGANINEELGEVVRRASASIPFVLLLLIRFVAAYVAQFVSLLGLVVFQHRIHHIFHEQISLKSGTDRNLLWTLFAVSWFVLAFIYFMSESLIGFDVVERLSMKEFQPAKVDFISIVMLCYFSDSTLRLITCAVKIAVYFAVVPRVGVRENYSATACFPNFSSLQSHFIPGYSSFTRSGFIDMFLSSLRQRSISRQRENFEDLTNLRDEENQHVEFDPLLNQNGGRRRPVHLPSHDVMHSVRERSTSSASSDLSQSVTDVVEREAEVMAYMKVKRYILGVDSVGALYRCMLSFPVWTNFFVSGPGSYVLVHIYVAFKLILFLDYIILVFQASKLFFLEKLEFGSFSTQDEIAHSGSPNCSICFESYYRPVTLNCKHVFCYHCIHEWVENKKNCPICRTDISGDPIYQKLQRLSVSTVPFIL